MFIARKATVGFYSSPFLRFCDYYDTIPLNEGRRAKSKEGSLAFVLHLVVRMYRKAIMMYCFLANLL